MQSSLTAAALLAMLVLGVATAQDCPYTPFKITQTFGFQERFLGNCFAITEKARASVSADFCHDYWRNFSDVYATRANIDIVPDLYYPVVETTQNQVNRFFNFSATLFWSGAKDEKGILSENEGYLTLEGTLVGFTADTLSWCGNNTATCNYEESVPWNSKGAGASFWGAASKWFARQARDEVSVLLMARTPCEFNRSIFANVEVHEFQPDQVTRMIIYLLKKDGIVDQCHPPAGNIITINKMVNDTLGFVPECEDDNEVILGILCSHPENVEKDFCKDLQEEVNKKLLTPLEAGLSFGFSILGALLIGVILTAFYYRRRAAAHTSQRKSNPASEPLLS